MASLVTGSNSHGLFPVGTPEGACLCSPSQGYQRSHGKTSNCYDNGWCQNVKACSSKCYVVHSHLSLNSWRLLWIPIITTRLTWFDHSTACTIRQWCAPWKLNVTGHMLYNIFNLFLTRIHTMNSLCSNFISLCILHTFWGGITWINEQILGGQVCCLFACFISSWRNYEKNMD